MSKREAVLARMLTVLSGLFTFNRVARNLDQFPATARPFGILLDGDEEFPEQMRQGFLSGPAKHPVIMYPVINISVGGTPSGIGTEANELLADIQTQIMTDSELAGIIGTNGRIHYMGANFNVNHSLDMDVDVQVNFAVHYILNPNSP